MQLPKNQNTGSLTEYHYANAAIGIVVLLMFAAAKFRWVSVHCVYAQNGMRCTTCGLTTAFNHIINGNFNHIPTAFWVLFILFAGQLVIRPLVSLLLTYTRKLKLIRNCDVILSVVVLVLFLVLVYG